MAAPSVNRGIAGRVPNRTGGKPPLTRAQVSRTYSVAAPTGGLNAISGIAHMPETDALVCDNWFPQPSYLQVRNGYGKWATGLPDWVETLMAYDSGAAQSLFGISNKNVYDCTAQGAVGAAVVTGLTNSRFESINIATAGGQFLYAANATDDPLLYDGTTWYSITGASVPYAITGVTTTTLRNPCLWKSRVWFVIDGTLSACYLPTGAIAGAASTFDFTAIFRLGGQLQAIFTFSLLDSSTFGNYIGFLTTEGEIAIYQGTDPAFAGTFALVGIYKTGIPVGRRCILNYGTDALLLTSDGLVSVTKLMQQGRVNTAEAPSYKIQFALNSDIQAYNANWGWELALYPQGNKVFINVPATTESTIYQYVMNTIHGAWCTFGKMASPWAAATFCVLGNSLYFGGKDYVALADSGQSDDNTNIQATLKTAFTYMGTDTQKYITMCRPIVLTDGNLTVISYLNMDFQDQPSSAAPTFTGSAGSAWNTSSWNTSPWAVGLTPQKNWQTVGGVGFAASLYFSAAVNDITCQLASIDYVFQPGGVL